MGIDPKNAIDLEEADGSVVNGGGSGSSQGSEGSSSNGDSNGATSGTTGGNATSAQERVREAMDKVKKARTEGTFEEFGKALDELDKAVADLQTKQ